jgi:RNA polymerase sigma-70 factor, ECF subfamily
LDWNIAGVVTLRRAWPLILLEPSATEPSHARDAFNPDELSNQAGQVAADAMFGFAVAPMPPQSLRGVPLEQGAYVSCARRAYGFSVNPPEIPREETDLVVRLRLGDESAFLALVERYHPMMVRTARAYLGDGALAEDAVQEAWMGALEGIGRFEGRSSLKSWLTAIVLNCARTRARRELRSVPFSALGAEEAEENEPAVDPSRFRGADDPYPRHWAAFPSRWPDDLVEEKETTERIRRAIDALPPMQRMVITLRDVEGWDSEETCRALNLSEGNQRVLLHRARSRVRAAVEEILGGGKQ